MNTLIWQHQCFQKVVMGSESSWRQTIAAHKGGTGNQGPNIARGYLEDNVFQPALTNNENELTNFQPKFV